MVEHPIMLKKPLKHPKHVDDARYGGEDEEAYAAGKGRFNRKEGHRMANRVRDHKPHSRGG
jgi:hypothetical protein